MNEEQYIRKCTLLVSNNDYSLDFSQLRITFQVKRSDIQSPNLAAIRIWNVTRDTAEKIEKEFNTITLQAGYEENFGVIFQGNIKEAKFGRENGVDTYLDIRAADGDQDYNFAIVNKTISAGATQRNIADAALSSMAFTNQGFIDDLGKDRLPRGKVMYGNAKKFLRQVAGQTDSSWSIQDGKLQIVKLRSLLPSEAVVLNARTGLIDTPEQTTKGVKARCLLNPKLKIAGRVNIDSDDIKLAMLKDEEKPTTDAKDAQPVALSVDGIYRVFKVEFIGDTRGNDWFCDLTLLDVDASAPKGQEVDEI
jgi:hypothetical protein